MRGGAISSAFNPYSPHLEACKGSEEQNINYCSKEETRRDGPFTFGDRAKPGKRSDWDAIRECLEVGGGYEQCVDVAFGTSLRFESAIRREVARRLPQRSEPPEVVVLWGPTGTGKSHTAHIACPDAYRKDPTTNWWDGYCGQENVIVDEFEGAFPLSNLLRWIDKYPVVAQVKGGYVDLKFKKIYFTSNFPVSEWYPRASLAQKNALDRRITRVEHMTVRYDGNAVDNEPAVARDFVDLTQDV